jgi:hypothetical protein
MPLLHKILKVFLILILYFNFIISFINLYFPSESLIALGFPYNRDDSVIKPHLERIYRILKNCREIRRDGSAALGIFFLYYFLFFIIFKKIIVKKCIRGFLTRTLNLFTHAFLYGTSNKVAAAVVP